MSLSSGRNGGSDSCRSGFGSKISYICKVSFYAISYEILIMVDDIGNIGTNLSGSSESSQDGKSFGESSITILNSLGKSKLDPEKIPTISSNSSSSFNSTIDYSKEDHKNNDVTPNTKQGFNQSKPYFDPSKADF